MNPDSPCNDDESTEWDKNSFWISSLLVENRLTPTGIPCIHLMEETRDIKALNACVGIRSGFSMNMSTELKRVVFCAHVMILSIVDDIDDEVGAFIRSIKEY